ncbi:hypothetical protein, partial [Paraprevotella clara]|uniref:hypothetical protein n=1 Tax=Paraprevotella clara TaxID=454154 RepID=UPI00307CE15B
SSWPVSPCRGACSDLNFILYKTIPSTCTMTSGGDFYFSGCPYFIRYKTNALPPCSCFATSTNQYYLHTTGGSRLDYKLVKRLTAVTFHLHPQALPG